MVNFCHRQNGLNKLSLSQVDCWLREKYQIICQIYLNTFQLGFFKICSHFSPLATDRGGQGPQAEGTKVGCDWFFLWMVIDLWLHTNKGLTILMLSLYVNFPTTCVRWKKVWQRPQMPGTTSLQALLGQSKIMFSDRHCHSALSKDTLKDNINKCFNFSCFQEYVGQHVRFLEDAMCRWLIWYHSQGEFGKS